MYKRRHKMLKNAQSIDSGTALEGGTKFRRKHKRRGGAKIEGDSI